MPEFYMMMLPHNTAPGLSFLKIAVRQRENHPFPLDSIYGTICCMPHLLDLPVAALMALRPAHTRSENREPQLCLAG